MASMGRLSAANLGATIAISAISYRSFETPFLRLKTRYQHIRSASPAVA
jgi:peptidoglycan/LPS O-acetylase OafA/YrhL